MDGFPDESDLRTGHTGCVLIDAYVADLGRSLRGPARPKADLLREARDGLYDAAAAYRDDGVDPETAQHRAVRDFGDVRDIAPDYQAELAAAQGRRTALLICLVLAPQSLLWQYVGGALAEGHERAAAPGYAVVDALTAGLGTAAVIGTILAALACGVGVRYLPGFTSTSLVPRSVVGSRYLRATRLAVLATGYFAYVVTAMFVASGLLMVALGPTEAFSPAGLPMYLLCLVLPLVWVARSGRRCIVAAPVRPAGDAARSR
jgi:hypothetical protein